MDAADFGLLPRAVQGTFADAWATGCEGPLRALFAGSCDAEGCNAVDAQHAVRVSAAPLYSALYHLCVATPADNMLDVYAAIAALFSDEANAARTAVQRACKDGTGAMGIAATYARQWQRYCAGVERTDAVCLYVNRVIGKLVNTSGISTVDVYVDASTPTAVAVRSIDSLGVAVWRAAVGDLFPLVVGPIVEVLTTLRKSFSLDDSASVQREACSVLSAAVRSFAWHTYGDEDAYGRDLEPALLAATERFYSESSRHALFDTAAEVRTDVGAYAAFAERMLKAEESLWTLVGIDAAASERVLHAARTELLTAHSPLLERALEDVLEAALSGDENASSALGRVHLQLSAFRGGAAPFGRALRACIAAQCRRAASLGDAVSGVLAVYAWARQLTAQSLSACEKCAHAANEAVTASLADMPGVDIASLLAERIHALLVRSSAFNATDSAGNDSALGDAVSLAALVPDTDAFARAYGRLLAARLVFRSAHGVSPATEAAMVAGLQSVVGADSAVRWRRMLADAHASAMLADTFRAEWIANNMPPRPAGAATEQLVDVSAAQPLGVAVASYVVWPLEAVPADQAALYAAPASLCESQGAFEKMYARVWPNRRLAWLGHLARATLVWRAAGDPAVGTPAPSDHAVELVVNVPQARALLLFASADALPLADVIAALCNVSEPSGAHAETALAVLAPVFAAGVLVRDGDVVRVGTLAHAGHRLVLAPPTIDAMWTPHGASSLHTVPDASPMPPTETHDGGPCDDRQRYALQAHLVRIFKTHRELSLQRAAQLVRGEEDAVLSATDVSRLSTRAISAVIDQLVEKEYVEADARSGLYRYVP